MKQLFLVLLVLGIIVYGLVKFDKPTVYPNFAGPLDPFDADTIFRTPTNFPHPDGNPWGHCYDWNLTVPGIGPTVGCDNMKAI